MENRIVRVGDLPLQPAPGVKLLCLDCMAEYSATRGDYFMSPPDSQMECCGDSMKLVKERRVWQEVTA